MYQVNHVFAVSALLSLKKVPSFCQSVGYKKDKKAGEKRQRGTSISFKQTNKTIPLLDMLHVFLYTQIFVSCQYSYSIHINFLFFFYPLP